MRGSAAEAGEAPDRPDRADGSSGRAGHRPGFAVGRHADRKPRPLAGASRSRQNERTAALVNQLVDQLGQMRGAAMKVGQVLSMVEFDGLPEERA